MYIGTNVLMYERWLVLKVRYTAGRPYAFATPSTHIAYMHVTQKYIKKK